MMTASEPEFLGEFDLQSKETKVSTRCQTCSQCCTKYSKEKEKEKEKDKEKAFGRASREEAT